MSSLQPRPAAPPYKVPPAFVVYCLAPSLVVMVATTAIARAFCPHVSSEVIGSWAGLMGAQYAIALGRRMPAGREMALFFVRAAAVNGAVYLVICAAAELAAR